MLVPDSSVTGATPVRTWHRSHAPGNLILGTAAGTLEGEETATVVVVSHFEVMPEARGQGVGKALLAEVDAVAAEVAAVRVVIVTDCPIERMFFIRAGYAARDGGVSGLQTAKHYAVEKTL